jgi:hypothetical protein
MKIDGPGFVSTSTVGRRSQAGGKPSSSSFVEVLADSGEAAEIGKVSAVGLVAGPVAVSPLMALQEVEDPASGRRKARRRAAHLLDHLDGLRHALLAGDLTPDAIQGLIGLVASQRPTVDDPALAAVLDEIDLRAQVELAKLESRD